MYIVGLPYDGLPFAPSRMLLKFPGDGLTFYSREELEDVSLVPFIGSGIIPAGCYDNPDGSHRHSGFTYYEVLIVSSHDFFCAYNGPDLADFRLHQVTTVDWNRKTILRLIKALTGTLTSRIITKPAESCHTA